MPINVEKPQVADVVQRIFFSKIAVIVKLIDSLTCQNMDPFFCGDGHA